MYRHDLFELYAENARRVLVPAWICASLAPVLVFRAAMGFK